MITLSANNREELVWKYTKIAYALPVIIGVIFALIIVNSFQSAGDTASAAGKSNIIALSIIVPELIVWMIATAGAVRFKQYADSIKSSKDGQALNHIANGLLLLVIYIILLSTSNAIVRLFKDTPYLDTAIAIGNHLPVAVALASVAFLFIGARRLRKINDSIIWTKTRTIIFAIGCGIFFVIFAYAFYKGVPTLEPINGIPRFAFSVETLLFTYVLPHIVLWIFGILACIDLAHFAGKTQGRIYRTLFDDLYKGIMLIYICVFLAQFLIVSNITYTNLALALSMIFGLLLLAVYGFFRVLRGAQKLQKLET